MSIRSAIPAALLPLFMFFSIVPGHGDDLCDKRVRRAEDNLRKEIRKHGEHSSQALYRRRQLEEARESCGFHRGHSHTRSHDHGRSRG